MSAAFVSFLTLSLSDLTAQDWSITQRGLNDRVLQRTNRMVLPNGRVLARSEGYTEIAVGLHHQQDGQGAWLESREEIELFQDGAVARQGPTRVIFSPNAATVGAIDVQTPDGQRLRSHVLGLGLFDPSTGNSILFSATKESIGQLHPPHTIIYPDAFENVAADIRYRYRKIGLSQDIILRQQVELPPGFNPTSTILEIWTEFLTPPEPQQTVVQKAGLTDATLRFGTMTIGPGKAFSLGDGEAVRMRIPVFKSWLNTEQRSFLVEGVRVAAANAELARLGLPQAKLQNGIRPMAFAAHERPFPKTRQLAKKDQKIQTAFLPSTRRGLAIDYELGGSYGSLRLKSDSTYFFSSDATVDYLLIEGGAVLKFAPGATLRINPGGTIDCQTSPYLKAVLTSKNDNTVGATISGSTGNPAPDASFGSPYLYLVESSDLAHLRFAYGNPPIYYDIDSGSHSLRHAQFVHCPVGIWIDDDASFKLGNVLMYDLDTAIYGNSWSGTAEHLTVHQANALTEDEALVPVATLTLTNCLLVNVTNWGDASITTNSTVKTSGNSVLQTVGAGGAYLSARSPFRNIGTTTITPSLLNDIRKTTTYPPLTIELSGTCTNNIDLLPMVQRDTDQLDIGAHYWPMDYVLGGLVLTNANLTLSNGVVIGTRRLNGDFAIALGQNASLFSEGTPDRPNRIVRYNTVQEQSTTNWATAPEFRVYTGWTPSAASARIATRFTHWITLAGGGEHFYSPATDTGTHHFEHTEFHNSDVLSIRPTLTFTNCLLNRVGLNLVDDAEAISPILRNCTLRGGAHNIFRFNGGTWTFQNNVFDDVTNVVQDAVLSLGYNRYTTNSYVLTNAGTGDLRLNLTNFTFVQSTLGWFYVLTNLVNHTNLFDSGSTMATNVGLYSFTIRSNQVKEAASTVDLGYHHASTDANGIPLDQDLDGIIDVFEDRDGDGLLDSGETNWQEYNSLFGIGPGPGLVVFTPLK